MTIHAAGEFRRTQLERDDLRVSWDRTDQAFFSAGACHVLAWTCREAYPERDIELEALRFVDDGRVFHTYATWQGWTFDASGWHLEPLLLEANQAFETRPVERMPVTIGLAEFCEEHRHAMPHQYWQDPRPRAHRYVAGHAPPWQRVTS